ncbi:hypothetical protein D3C86_1331050 [compost metagenome]
MLNGLWHIVFQVPGDHGGGVVVIDGGKALGGDAACTYIGEIKEQSGQVSGELAIEYVNKAFPPLIPQLPNYTVVVSGHFEGKSLKLVGKIPSVPGAPEISIIGTKHINL